MKNLFFALIAISLLAACGKRANVNGDVKNRREMLLAHKWQIVSITDNNKPYNMEECKKDNYFVFLDNGFGTWEEGANNCFDTVVNNGGGGNTTNNGGGNDTTSNNGGGTDTTGGQSKPTVNNPNAPTATQFTWIVASDQRDMYLYNFGAPGNTYYWMIDNMDYTTLDVTTSVKGNDGVYHQYKMKLAAK